MSPVLLRWHDYTACITQQWVRRLSTLKFDFLWFNWWYFTFALGNISSLDCKRTPLSSRFLLGDQPFPPVSAVPASLSWSLSLLLFTPQASLTWEPNHQWPQFPALLLITPVPRSGSPNPNTGSHNFFKEKRQNAERIRWISSTWCCDYDQDNKIDGSIIIAVSYWCL